MILTHKIIDNLVTQTSMATAASMAAVTEALAATPVMPESATSPSQPRPTTATSQSAPSAEHGFADIPDGPADLPTDDSTPDGDIAWLNVNELNPAEVDELQKCVNTCVERWKAAGPEARKKMFALFAISGIFIAVCRHGHVLIMCDMIRSGELYAAFFFFIWLHLNLLTE
jgi:hypothetical protein